MKAQACPPVLLKAITLNPYDSPIKFRERPTCQVSDSLLCSFLASGPQDGGAAAELAVQARPACGFLVRGSGLLVWG